MVQQEFQGSYKASVDVTDYQCIIGLQITRLKLKSYKYNAR